MSARRRPTRLGRQMGDRLQAVRLALGLTQKEAARRAGVRLRSLQEWEQGTRVPGFDKAIRLARGLGVSLDVLAGLAELPPPGRR